MSKRQWTSKSRWVVCRRKVQKFLTNLETLSEEGQAEQTTEETKIPCRSVGHNEWDHWNIARSSGQEYQCNDVSTAEDCELTGNAHGSVHSALEIDCESMQFEPEKFKCEKACCKLGDNCWTQVDAAEVESQSESDCEDADQLLPDAKQSIAHWACVHNITHSALNDLLKILKSQGLDVPLTATSLLNTSRNVFVEQKSGGEYIYFGLAKSILTNLSKMPDNHRQSLKSLELNVNIDGLPLYKSSSLSVWPILCSLSVDSQLMSTPFAVALFSGSKKPANYDFLLDFINESKLLYSEGIDVEGRLIPFKIACVICDAPAKAFVKGIVQFNGKYGCDRCVQKGHYCDGRMLFLQTEAPLRTNESFRSQENREHHKQNSPFCDLPMDMIQDFPIDYMHQVNLGVTKRLVLAWVCGPLKSRLSSGQIETINSKLQQIRSYMPKEFARRPRSLEYVRMWKATEFRQFLLYTGPIVLRKVLDEAQYLNFLSLSCGISLLMNTTLAAEHKDYANQLLHFFVHDSVQLYGQSFVTYNVHSLIHMAEVVERYGSLEHCSAYPFENYMQTLKRYVRSTKNPLIQIAHRLEEFERNVNVGQSLTERKCKLDFSVNSPDNCFIVANGHICLCLEFLGQKNEALCRVFTDSSSLYEKPCDSRLLGIHKVLLKNSKMMTVSLDSFVKKAIFVHMNDKYGVILSFLHSY